MRERQWYCPAVDREIDDSVCHEYQRAGKGAARRTRCAIWSVAADDAPLRDIDAFHKVCAGCAHGMR